VILTRGAIRGSWSHIVRADFRLDEVLAGYDIFHSAFNFWTVALLVSSTVQGGQLEFASTFDTRLLTINALLIGLMAVVFIVATRGELGKP